MEKKGVRMEKVGSEGIRVNGGQKCGVRMDRKGVRMDRRGVRRDQSYLGGGSVGSGWKGGGQ